MEGDRHEEDASGAQASMISSTSPYQPTTEPVPHRRSICAGLILDVQYLKSLPGLLKAVQILLCIIILICLGFVDMCSGNCSGVSFHRSVSVCALIVTIIIWLVFGLALKNKIPFINWVLTDLINAVLFAILFLISSSILASQSVTGADKAAIVFGFITMVAYGVMAWIGYRAFVIDRHKKKSNVSHIQGVPEHDGDDAA